jgi:hypothetical protein
MFVIGTGRVVAAKAAVGGDGSGKGQQEHKTFHVSHPRLRALLLSQAAHGYWVAGDRTPSPDSVPLDPQS